MVPLAGTFLIGIGADNVTVSLTIKHELRLRRFLMLQVVIVTKLSRSNFY